MGTSGPRGRLIPAEYSRDGASNISDKWRLSAQLNKCPRDDHRVLIWRRAKYRGECNVTGNLRVCSTPGTRCRRKYGQSSGLPEAITGAISIAEIGVESYELSGRAIREFTAGRSNPPGYARSLACGSGAALPGRTPPPRLRPPPSGHRSTA